VKWAKPQPFVSRSFIKLHAKIIEIGQ